MELPRIISVDDHVIEPAHVWDRLPKQMREEGPQCRREKGAFTASDDGQVLARRWVPDAELPGATWADVWYYEGMASPLIRGHAQCGYENDNPTRAVTRDEMLPSAHDPDARLADMVAHHTDVSICYPTIPRFCGQWFAERENKQVALESLRAYNDWIIEDWCGTPGEARLIPLTLIPLWDAQMAADEVRRCASKGSHAIAFTECPPALGLPSLYTDYWDPLLQACQETDTILNMHVGSSSKLTVTAPDAPTDVTLCLTYVNSMLAFTDWLYSGTLERFKEIRIALAESQVGWIPFAAQRVDNTWIKANEKFAGEHSQARRATELPSQSLDRVFGCVFDDLEGLRNKERVGMGQILIETDFPHSDSTYPHSKKVIEQMCDDACLGDDDVYSLVRGNAIRAYGLDKYFGVVA